MRTYANPNAFKAALDARLQQQARHDGTPFARKRMLVVFDRFLARIDRHFADAVILKGGLALELRLTRARTTKDVDLRMMGSVDGLPWINLARVTEIARQFLNPVLSSDLPLTWSPGAWRWHPPGAAVDAPASP